MKTLKKLSSVLMAVMMCFAMFVFASCGGDKNKTEPLTAYEFTLVYENGKPVYDEGKLRTINVETVRYKQTPARFAEPEKRDDIERKPPRRKM